MAITLDIFRWDGFVRWLTLLMEYPPLFCSLPLFSLPPFLYNPSSCVEFIPPQTEMTQVSRNRYDNIWDLINYIIQRFWCEACFSRLIWCWDLKYCSIFTVFGMRALHNILWHMDFINSCFCFPFLCPWNVIDLRYWLLIIKQRLTYLEKS